MLPVDLLLEEGSHRCPVRRAPGVGGLAQQPVTHPVQPDGCPAGGPPLQPQPHPGRCGPLRQIPVDGLDLLLRAGDQFLEGARHLVDEVVLQDLAFLRGQQRRPLLGLGLQRGHQGRNVLLAALEQHVHHDDAVAYGHPNRMAVAGQRVGEHLVFGRDPLLHQLPATVGVVDPVQCGVDGTREHDGRCRRPRLARVRGLQFGHGDGQQAGGGEGSQLLNCMVTFGGGGGDRSLEGFTPALGLAARISCRTFRDAGRLLVLVAPDQFGGDRGERAVQLLDAGARRLDQDPVTFGRDVGLGARQGRRRPGPFAAFHRKIDLPFGIGGGAARPVQRLRRRPQPGQGHPVVAHRRPDGVKRDGVCGQTDIGGELAGGGPRRVRVGLPAGHDRDRLGVPRVDTSPDLVLAGEFDVSLTQLPVGRLRSVLGGQETLAPTQFGRGRRELAQPLLDPGQLRPQLLQADAPGRLSGTLPDVAGGVLVPGAGQHPVAEPAVDGYPRSATVSQSPGVLTRCSGSITRCSGSITRCPGAATQTDRRQQGADRGVGEHGRAGIGAVDRRGEHGGEPAGRRRPTRGEQDVVGHGVV